MMEAPTRRRVRGRGSRTSFAEAAQQAVEKAEEELRPSEAPDLYDVTLRVTVALGSSLSEYIAMARGAATGSLRLATGG